MFSENLETSYDIAAVAPKNHDTSYISNYKSNNSLSESQCYKNIAVTAFC